MCYEKYFSALINMVRKKSLSNSQALWFPTSFFKWARGCWNSLKWAEMVFVTSGFAEVELLLILMEKSSVHHGFP